MSDPEPLRLVVGRRVRALRESAELRQQDVADALREVGVSWMPTRVAAVERGDKAIGVEDLVVLAAALERASSRPTSVVDLVWEQGCSIRLHDGAHIAGEDLAATLGGAPAGELPVVATDADADTTSRDPVTRALAEHLGWPAAGMIWGRVRYTLSRFGEPDERAARQLGISREAFAVVCHELWGATLTRERDRRLGVDEDLGSAAGPSVAARRGRASRTLLAEARALLAAAGVTDLPAPA